MSPFLQNPKFQEPVTLDFLDAELENDLKVEVCSTDEQMDDKMLHLFFTNR